MSSEFSIPIKVYIEDTDAGGIVYYVNYLKFMERARTEFLRTRGILKPAVLEGGFLMVVADISTTYMKSARLDDDLRATATLKKRARSYIVFEQSVWRDDECLTKAEVRVACVQQATMKPCAFPELVKRALSI